MSTSTSASTTTILLSGGNTGIGYEIAKRLLTTQENIHLYLGSRDVSKGDAAVSKIKSLPEFNESSKKNTVETIQLDLLSDSSIASCVSTITSKTGHLDVLINNAGVAPLPADSSPAALRKAYAAAVDTNIAGTAIVTDACIPLFEKSRSAAPRIVLITSGLSSLARVSAAKNPNARKSELRPYVVSKAGMNMLAVGYAGQFRAKGWKVNLVCPGLRNTGLMANMSAAGDPAEGAIEAVKLAMDDGKIEDGARTGGLWDWDGTEISW